MSGLSKSRGKKVADREDVGVVRHMTDETNEKMYFRPENMALVSPNDLTAVALKQELDAGTIRPVTFTIVGTYSHTFRRAVEAQRERNLKNTNASGDSYARNSVELDAACVPAWDGPEQDGKPMDLTLANVADLLEENPWLRAQVQAEANDHAGFSRRSSAS